MAALTPVSRNIDQNQHEGDKKEANVLATREAKELAAQLVWQHIGDSNMENTLTQSKHEERWELKTLKSMMERADRKK